MSHVRFIWPTITPCPKCDNPAWWAVKTLGPANMRKCRNCGEWFRIEATHEEILTADGNSSVIRAITQASGKLPASKGK